MPPPSKKKNDNADDDDLIIEEPELADDDPMRAFFPKSFGKQAKTNTIVPKYDATKRGAAATEQPKAIEDSSAKKKGSDKSDDDDDDSDDDSDSMSDDDEEEFPVSNELLLKDHTKAVTSVSLDPAGMRICTASQDMSMKFYDFSSMSADHLHSFKSVEPFENHIVNKVEFSINGEHVLAVPASAQAKILTRDGQEVVEFVKGDQYLRDMNNTKGHVSEINSGTWHPTDRNYVVTAGSDSTLRIWDVNQKREQRQVIVVKSRSAHGGRTKMLCVEWDDPNRGGRKLLGAGAYDGSLTLWAGDGPYNRPVSQIYDAHARDSGICSLAFSSDGNLLVTRGMDGLVKSWDTRKMKTPIMTRDNLPVTFSQTSISFSPDSQHLLTSDSAGNLHILSPATLRSEFTTAVSAGHSLISTLWHPKINHILATSSSGTTHVLFSPNTSDKGAKMVLSRAPKRRHIDDDPTITTDVSTGISADSVLLPNATLPGSRAKLNQASLKASLARKPFKPHVTPFAKNNPDEEHVKKNIALSGMRDEDPREALLKYADVAEKDPMFTGAWKETQPKTIYAERNEDDDEEEETEKDRVKRLKRYY